VIWAGLVAGSGWVWVGRILRGSAGPKNQRKSLNPNRARMVDLAQETVNKSLQGRSHETTQPHFSLGSEVGLRDRTRHSELKLQPDAQQQSSRRHELLPPRGLRRDAAIQNLQTRLRHAHGPHESDQGEPWSGQEQRNGKLLHALRVLPTSSQAVPEASKLQSNAPRDSSADRAAKRAKAVESWPTF